MGWKWVVTGVVNAKRKDRLAPVPVRVGVTTSATEYGQPIRYLPRLDLSHNHEF